MLVIILRAVSLGLLIYLLLKLLIENDRQATYIAWLKRQREWLKSRVVVPEPKDSTVFAYKNYIQFGDKYYILFHHKIFMSKTGLFDDAVVVHDFNEPRDLTPCFYCKRYDDKVEDFSTKIQNDGLKGHYHPHCASAVVHSAMLELTRRMA